MKKLIVHYVEQRPFDVVTLKVVGLPTEVRQFVFEVGNRQTFDLYLVALKSEPENGDTHGTYVYRFIVPAGQGNTLIDLAKKVATEQDLEIDDPTVPEGAETIPDLTSRIIQKPAFKEPPHRHRPDWGNVK